MTRRSSRYRGQPPTGGALVTSPFHRPFHCAPESGEKLMEKIEVSKRQKGIGYLVLKSGSCQQVEWEIEVFCDGSLGNGSVLGDENHLAAAAKDGCAKLRLESSHTVAIAIDNQTGAEASFSILLHSSMPHIFQAQTIVGSSTILDGNQFSFEFRAADGEQLLVVVPTIIIRDYLPVLEKAVPPASTPAKTSFFRIAEKWATAMPASYPLVCMKFDDDEPVALHPEDARLLATELIDLAKEVETRSHNVH
jgi:hypothetical protein